MTVLGDAFTLHFILCKLTKDYFIIYGFIEKCGRICNQVFMYLRNFYVKHSKIDLRCGCSYRNSSKYRKYFYMFMFRKDENRAVLFFLFQSKSISGLKSVQFLDL